MRSDQARRQWALTATLCCVMAWGGCRGTPSQATGQHVAVVKEIEDEAVVTASGTIVPGVGGEIKIGAQVSGRLQRLHVRVGDIVQKGEVVAELDPTPFVATLALTSAGVTRAEADLEYATAARERVQQLFRDGLVARQELDVANRDWKSAMAALAEAQAAKRTASVTLEYTRVVSPMDGIVASVSTQEGETVAASFAAPTFVTVLDPNNLTLIVYIDEIDLGHITPGFPVTFTVEALPDHVFEGSVRSIDPTATVRDGIPNFVVHVDVRTGFQGLLRPSMSAVVQIPTGQARRLLVVPDAAILHEDGNAYVWTVVAGKAEKRHVEVGERVGNGYAITQGLAKGQQVLVGDNAKDGTH